MVNAPLQCGRFVHIKVAIATQSPDLVSGMGTQRGIQRATQYDVWGKQLCLYTSMYSYIRSERNINNLLNFDQNEL